MVQWRAGVHQTATEEGAARWQELCVQRHRGKAKPGVFGELQVVQRSQERSVGREEKARGSLESEA